MTEILLDSAENTPRNHQTELVFKVISWSKRASDARRLAKDIGCPDDGGVFIHPLETETGRDLINMAELEAELAKWHLLTKSNNLSSKARKATPEARKAMSENDMLYLRQSVHMLVSLPEGYTSHALQLQLAVHDYLVDTIGEAGHRYYFSLHTHDSRPHVHIVAQVRSKADGGRQPRQLNFSPSDFDAIRLDIVRRLQEVGVSITATRCTERPSTAIAP